jgi:hypothetical protein
VLGVQDWPEGRSTQRASAGKVSRRRSRGRSRAEDHGFRVVAGVQEFQNEKIGIVPRALIFLEHDCFSEK